MSTTEFIRSSLKQMHNTYDDAIADLTTDQLHWRANEKGCPVSFILWHYVRTEDNIVQFILQDRKPTVWVDGPYQERWGLEKVTQGTAATAEESAAASEELSAQAYAALSLVAELEHMVGTIASRQGAHERRPRSAAAKEKVVAIAARP